MTVTYSGPRRCERCERVGYDRRQMAVGVLCPRCISDLGDLLRAFMKGER